MNVRLILKLWVMASICFAYSSGISAQDVPAFPGAEGFGANVTGGRGGSVIKVTNLNDSGAGSLRAAINASGTRTIVFEVSGIIELQSALNITHGNVTIAGQTAPGDGICIRNYNTVVDADNVIIRFIRFRLGDAKSDQEDDALWGRYHNNIIIDHCSMSWSVDEVSSFYDNENFTMQYCILSEALYESIHDKGQHSYGGIWGGQGATFHHNMLAHNSSRNPRFQGSRDSNEPELEKVDFRNNVIYNWGGNSGYAGEGGYYNMINNYYKPSNASSNRNRIFEPYSGDDGYGNFYVAGNYFPYSTFTTEDNWAYGMQGISSETKEEIRLDEPVDVAPVTTHSAQEAFEHVLAQGGAVLPKRDAVDQRIVYEARTGTTQYGGEYGEGLGIIDTPSDAGGYPTYESAQAPTDTDNDGMPDDWETDRGLNPSDAADRNGDDDSDGYTNLEEYLNELVEQYTYLVRPINYDVTLNDNNVSTITWEDISENENGFIIERQNNGTYEQIGSVNADVTTFEDPTQLNEGDTAIYRMKAFNDTDTSYYTDTLMVWSKVITGIDQSFAENPLNLNVYPNPFSNQLHISMDLPTSGEVSMKMYNVNGELVNSRVYKHMEQGEQQISWNLSDKLTGGIYYISIKTKEYKQLYKVVKL